jgi:5-methylcytosine-specific restriction protein A
MSQLSKAVDFISVKALDPVLINPAASKKLRFQTEHTRKVLKSFGRIGDLITYFKRFEPSDNESETMKSVRDIGTPAFEDIYDEFMSRYGSFENDRTRLSDFVVGQSYTTWDLVNFAGLYNTRGGGILPIGPDENRIAIFIRATLDGSGDYPNEWIEPGVVLKYYMMGITAVPLTVKKRPEIPVNLL